MQELKGPGGKLDLSLIPAHLQPTFSIEPEHALIPAKESLTFMMSGFSAQPGIKEEAIQFLAGAGAQVRKPQSRGTP